MDRNSDSRLRIDGPSGSAPTLVFAHGAGAPMDSPWMNDMAEALAASGLRVVRFDFPYMARRRDTGVRSPPNPMPVLDAAFRDVLLELRSDSALFLAGKSMGGRVASMLVDDVGARGLICFGYPFHPQGKPDRLRIAHLATLRTPTLIVQGTRDALGSRAEVVGYPLSAAIRITWIEDGDHSLAPRKAAGRSVRAAQAEAVAAVAAFVRGLSESKK